MPAYQFTAIDDTGKSRKGVLEGDSARQIRQQLREKSWMPVDVVVVEEARVEGRRWWQTGLSAYDLALFTRQLAVLLAAGIPLEEALRAVARQTEKKRVNEVLLAVRSRVLEGQTLASSLERSGSFPALYVATIAAGERSGHLDLILEQLADYTENRHAMQKNVQKALIYPVLLSLMSFLIVMGLMTYVVPEIARVFTQTRQQLPAITEFMLAASAFIRSSWPYLLVLSIIGMILLTRFLRTEPGRYALDRLCLRLPLIGRLSRGINAARLASTLSILSRSGVPLVEGLRIAAAVSGNWLIRDAILQARDRVIEGANLSGQIEKTGYFPPMMVQMIRSGENSGELERMLGRAASMQDRDVNTLIGTMLALLEPLMLIIMAVIVFVIIASVILPIVQMNDLVK